MMWDNNPVFVSTETKVRMGKQRQKRDVNFVDVICVFYLMIQKVIGSFKVDTKRKFLFSHVKVHEKQE